MYIRKMTALALLLIYGAACSKSDDPNTEEPLLVGYWQGEYGRGASTPNLPYMILFRSNGTVRIYAGEADSSKASKAEGSYAQDAMRLTMQYTYVSGPFSGTYSGAGTINRAGNQITGTYGSGNAQNGGGSFTLSRP